jgi:polysaccharide biosynthesis protein PslJ
VVAGALAVLTLAAVLALPMEYVAPFVGVTMVGAAFHRELLAWPSLVGALIVVILVIPIRRYTLSVDAGPFELEPYRVLVGFIVIGWIASLLVDRRVRLRSTGLEGPIALIWIAIVGSIFVNLETISALGLEQSVVKNLTFFASFFVVLYLIVSVVPKQTLRKLVEILVGLGALVAASAVIESRTGTNMFNGLASWIPFLQEHYLPYQSVGLDDAGFARGERLRTYASAEHPIALSAVLAMLAPVALALRLGGGGRRWYVAAAFLTLGALATVSRTGVVMLLVIGLVFLWLRPMDTVRLWWLIIPLVFIVHAVLPSTMGSLKSSFFPEGGLIEEQRSSAGSRTAGGRVADLAPTLAEVSRKPFLGVGYGSQVVHGQQAQDFQNPPEVAAEAAKARILDNQWLGTLLEVGILGVLSWLWFFRRFIARVARAAKADHSERGWMLVAIASAVFAYAVGALTFDAFAFVQSVFVLFILIGFGTVLLRTGPEPAPEDAERVPEGADRPPLAAADSLARA